MPQLGHSGISGSLEAMPREWVEIDPVRYHARQESKHISREDYCCFPEYIWLDVTQGQESDDEQDHGDWSVKHQNARTWFVPLAFNKDIEMEKNAQEDANYKMRGRLGEYSIHDTSVDSLDLRVLCQNAESWWSDEVCKISCQWTQILYFGFFKHSLDRVLKDGA